MLRLLFLAYFLISACKSSDQTIEGNFTIIEGQTLSIKYDNYSGIEVEPLPSNSYVAFLDFKTDQLLTFTIQTEEKDYNIDAYLNKGFPKIIEQKKKKTIFTITEEELDQEWNIQGSIEVQYQKRPEQKGTESCVGVKKVWTCDDFAVVDKDQYNCHWEENYKYGTKSIKYYEKISTYNILANIVDLKTSNTIGVFTASQKSTERVFISKSCCRDYSDYLNSCLEFKVKKGIVNNNF